MEKQVMLKAHVALVSRAAKLMQAGVDGIIDTTLYEGLEYLTFEYNGVKAKIHFNEEGWEAELEQAIAALDAMIQSEKERAENALAVLKNA